MEDLSSFFLCSQLDNDWERSVISLSCQYGSSPLSNLSNIVSKKWK